MGPSLTTLTYDLADAANAAKDYYNSPAFAGEWVIRSAVYTPSSAGAVAIDGTNNRTITLSIAGTSIGVLTTNTGGTALVAGTPVPISISGAEALPLTGLTDALKVATTYGGTGGAANGLLQVGLERVRA